MTAYRQVQFCYKILESFPFKTADREVVFNVALHLLYTVKNVKMLHCAGHIYLQISHISEEQSVE